MVSKNFEREPNELIVLNTVLKKSAKKLFVPNNLFEDKKFIETMKNLGFGNKKGRLNKEVNQKIMKLFKKLKVYRLD